MTVPASLTELSHCWRVATTDKDKMHIVAHALLNEDLDTFIEFYRVGWLGTGGEFARILARVRQAALL